MHHSSGSKKFRCSNPGIKIQEDNQINDIEITRTRHLQKLLQDEISQDWYKFLVRAGTMQILSQGGQRTCGYHQDGRVDLWLPTVLERCACLPWWLYARLLLRLKWILPAENWQWAYAAFFEYVGRRTSDCGWVAQHANILRVRSSSCEKILG